MKRCYESADISWFRLFWSPNHSKCSATHSPNSSYTEAYMQGYVSNRNAPLIFQCSAQHTYTHWTAIGEQFGFQFLPHENFDVSPGGSWDRTTDLSINGLPVLLSRGHPYSGWQLQKQERASPNNISAYGLWKVTSSPGDSLAAQRQKQTNYCCILIMHICVCTRDRLNRSISDGLSAADTFLVTFDNHTTTLRNTVLELGVAVAPFWKVNVNVALKTSGCWCCTNQN